MIPQLKLLVKSCVLLLLFAQMAFGQESIAKWNPYSLDTLNVKRARTVIAIESGLAIGSSVGLYAAWYSGYEQSGFHFIDDSYGWLQIDKYGHAATGYHLVQFCYNMNRYAGISKKKSMWIAAGISLGFQTAVEIMDGMSAAWGASLTDAAFNTLGVGTFMLQEWLWEDQRIIWKYSFHPKKYDHFDPYVQTRASKLYSDAIWQQWLKDYNGQAYWLSVNPRGFAPNAQWLPPWLNVAVGYGAEGMLGANWNIWLDDQCYYDYSHIPRYRQYFLSLDVDFTKLPIQSKFYRWVAPYLNIFKLPFPTLELNGLGEVKGHWLYF